MRFFGNRQLRRPKLKNWKDWTYEDYLVYFLSAKAARARLRGEVSPASKFTNADFQNFCRPIRDRNAALFTSSSPRVSILLPAYNEEVELLPTLVAYSCLDVEPGFAELIVADNGSTDHTPEIINNCGVKYVHCPDKGVGFCRKAAYSAIAPSVEYIWLSDADTRIVAPAKDTADLSKKSTILRTSVRHLEQNPNVIGISTGAVIEDAHWMYRFIHRLAVQFGVSRKFSCWAGCNQFVRRWALDEIGGIDPTVDFYDDHYRHYELARLGKKLKMDLKNANSNPALVDPVYSSGRRYATLALTVRHFAEAKARPKLLRDEYGFPIHPRNKQWRQVRLSTKK